MNATTTTTKQDNNTNGCLKWSLFNNNNNKKYVKNTSKPQPNQPTIKKKRDKKRVQYNIYRA